MSDSEKLKTFRNREKLSQQAFADKLGVKQTLVSMIESGNREASAGFKLAFAKAYGIDWDSQLATGETYTMEHLNSTTKTLSNSIVPIPFYSAKAAAGTGEALPDYPEKDVIYFDSRWLKNVIGVNPDNISFIQAKGDSMNGGNHPILDGDLLMVDESYKEPINNQVFVINLGNNELVVKRINRTWDGQIILESNNPSYPSLTPEEGATIIGKVVWNGSKENV
jgi:phage repressor protein C with HTH and peptisase S24 domain